MVRDWDYTAPPARIDTKNFVNSSFTIGIAVALLLQPNDNAGAA